MRGGCARARGGGLQWSEGAIVRPCACVPAYRARGIVAGFRGVAALGTGAGGAGALGGFCGIVARGAGARGAWHSGRHCAALGGFSARGGALWRGAWRVYSGGGGRVENAQTFDL